MVVRYGFARTVINNVCDQNNTVCRIDPTCTVNSLSFRRATPDPRLTGTLYYNTVARLPKSRTVTAVITVITCNNMFRYSPTSVPVSHTIVISMSSTLSLLQMVNASTVTRTWTSTTWELLTKKIFFRFTLTVAALLISAGPFRLASPKESSKIAYSGGKIMPRTE